VEDDPFDVVSADYEFVMYWTTTDHTAVDVPLTAQGPGAALLTGNLENTEVHDAIAEALGVER
jgi:alkaline phosphatase